MPRLSQFTSYEFPQETFPYSMDEAVGHMLSAGLNPATLKNIQQVGWVSKSHPELFRSIMELTVCDVTAGIKYTQNPDWRPVFVIKGIGD